MLTPEQLAGVRERFRHFNPERCDGLFHEDQEAAGLFTVEGQGQFPGVRMANGSLWYYDPSRRPLRGDGQPMKTQAPPGERRLLRTPDTAQAGEVLLVEGEGHAVALASIGMTGVVACGGVNVFQSRRGWAQEELERLFRGKRVRLLFDPDAAGRRASQDVKRRLLEAGAVRVAVMPPQDDWEQGWDIEDWVAWFPSGADAYGVVMPRISGLPWEDNATEAEAEREDDAVPEINVRTKRVAIAGEDLGALVVTTYDEETKRLGLAVIGPPDDNADPAEHDSVRHDAEPDDVGMANGWQLLDAWIYDGNRYVPSEIAEDHERHTLLLPAPPDEGGYGTSEALWAEVIAFLRRWVVLPTAEDYHLLASYVFMSYRIFDAGFQVVPYLRFHGPPGSGKGRALSCMKALCCFSLDGQPSTANLHRVIQFYGEITLCIDEFHLDRGMSRDRTEEIIDTLCLGNDREKVKMRCDSGPRGEMVVNSYSLFGPKVFAGYGFDEHEALARRSVNVNMGDVDSDSIPDEVGLYALPPEFYAQAYLVRRKLMAWRGAKYGLGMPDPRGARALKLQQVAGREVGQVLWPLLEMVPKGLPEAEEAILSAARRRVKDTAHTRSISLEALLLEKVSNMVPEKQGSRLLYPTVDIAELLEDSPVTVGRLVSKLGLGQKRIRMQGRRVMALMLSDTEQERDTFARFGVTHPADMNDNTNEETAL